MPFRALVGHRRLLGLLSRSIAGASLPPSLIFSGPEGVGKRAAALAVAQALNCPSPVAESESGLVLDACGSCPACGRIARGTHPDVQTIAPGESGSIKIEQVREAIAGAAYRPFEGRRRVFLVEEADALVPAAQNALLKTLEEPRPGSVFILIAAKADTLLATVRSRCSRLRFGPLTAGEVASVLVRDRGYGEREARAVAALADGSVSRALESARRNTRARAKPPSACCGTPRRAPATRACAPCSRREAADRQTRRAAAAASARTGSGWPSTCRRCRRCSET